MITRRKLIATGVGVAAGVTVAGCTTSGGDPSDVVMVDPNTNPVSENMPAGAAPQVTITPANDAKKVSPLEKVQVSVAGGTLKSVVVTAGDSKVAGTMTDDRTWHSTGRLAYGKTYKVTVSVADSTGVTAEQSTTFSTLKPADVAKVSFQANALAAIKAGETYGVGQTIRVHFSEKVKDRAAAEKGMQVETTPAVEGRWRWIDSKNAHWRPAKYWAAGTRISVKVDLFGVELGSGVYGVSASTHFKIGKSKIAVADSKTKRMKVYIDGKLVRDIPISMGKGGIHTTANGTKVNYWTRSGPHVVMTREKEHRMRSASYGVTDKNDPNYYDEVIKLCLRLTYSGEFVHMADWNIPAHGFRNTSHGCLNVGPSNARWFFDNFDLGDVVEVKNTPRDMALSDGVGGDWTIPWEKW